MLKSSNGFYLIKSKLFDKLKPWEDEKDGVSLIGAQKKPIKAENPAWVKNL